MADSHTVPPVKRGDLVNFVTAGNEAKLTRLAIVTRVWNQDSGCCDLFVFPLAGDQGYLQTSVCYSPPYTSGVHGNTWHELEGQQPEPLEFVTGELINPPQPTSIYFSPVFNIAGSSDLSDAVNAATQMFQSVLEKIRKP